MTEDRSQKTDDGGRKAEHGWVPGRRAVEAHPVG
jgi:hypothetical protein